ncbi:MAG: hypothetical protein ACXWKY_10480 [Caulobacteraceae bacterium]
MTRPVTFKTGQFLLLVFAAFMVGVGTGVLVAGLYWHVHGFAALSAPLQIVGMAALIVLFIWKSLDDWAERTGYTPLTRT